MFSGMSENNVPGLAAVNSKPPNKQLQIPFWEGCRAGLRGIPIREMLSGLNLGCSPGTSQTVR